MEALSDPYNDRVMKTVKPPPHRPLSHNLMYPDPGILLFLMKYFSTTLRPGLHCNPQAPCRRRNHREKRAEKAH